MFPICIDCSKVGRAEQEALGDGNAGHDFVRKLREKSVSATKQDSLFKGKLKSIRVAHCDVGRCLVAKKPIRRSKAVGHVQGKVIKNSKYGSEYCIDLGNGTSLEPAAPFRYLNHACEPNCELVLWRVPWKTGEASREVWLHTLRRIEEGEELTIDYAWPATAAIPCQCNSANCREWVVAEEELPLVKRRRKKKPR